VTGFLGPNGAGKTTTMRLILGLDYPSAGTVTVTVAGKPYLQLPDPMHQVGALLDAGAVHGGRTACHHLLALAQTNGIGRRRVDEVPACWARWHRRRVAACRSIRVPRLLSRIGPLARLAVAWSMARPTAGGSGTGTILVPLPRRGPASTRPAVTSPAARPRTGRPGRP
jgi:ABC-type branched-subunit amino acid transport system ATPase component